MKYKLNKQRLDYAKFLNLKLSHARLYLAKIFPKHYRKWNKINRKKDKSLSANNFRLWLYLRLLDEKYPMIWNKE